MNSLQLILSHDGLLNSAAAVLVARDSESELQLGNFSSFQPHLCPTRAMPAEIRTAMALPFIIVQCVLTLLNYLSWPGPAGMLSAMHYRDESRFLAIFATN